jgi:integrase
MPLKLVPPRKGKTPFWYVRGTYLGQSVERSTKTDRKAVAQKFIEKWQRQIERGEFATEGEPTFLSAAVSYLRHGGHARPVHRLIEHFGEKPLRQIDQAEIDAAALALFPNHSPATRNREVYTPVSAILKRAGVETKIRRPKGSRGRELTGWLWPEEAERLFKAADALDPEFGLLCRFLCYTGLRLKEATARFKIEHLRLSEGFAYIPTTKNGDPRPVFLPPHIVAALANHPRGLDRPGKQVFRWHKGGRLYTLLYKAARDAAVILPEREAFHIFRHTYGTWMRRYAGTDTKGLVSTGAWKSEQSASRYAHAVVSEEATKASLLPFGESVENGIEKKKT